MTELFKRLRKTAKIFPDEFGKLAGEAADAIERLQKCIDGDLICPHCSRTINVPDCLITYWGDEGWFFVECEMCDEEFEAIEYVARTFETRVTSAPGN